MKSRTKMCMAAMAAFLLGVPLAEEASAQTGAVGGIVTSAVALAAAIVEVATQGS